MISYLNNLLNNIFKLLRFCHYIVATLFWIILFPLIYLYYKNLHNYDIDYHPYTLLFITYVRIAELWSKIIF